MLTTPTDGAPDVTVVRVWISKYVVSSGVQEVDAHMNPHEPGWIRIMNCGIPMHISSKYYALTREDALVQGRREFARRRRIHTKAIARLDEAERRMIEGT